MTNLFMFIVEMDFLQFCKRAPENKYSLYNYISFKSINLTEVRVKFFGIFAGFDQ